MCGIAGVFDLRQRRRIDPGLLTAMHEVQAHRGPDDCGLHLEPGIGMSHRRLSIIDLSGGHQPLFNEDGSVCVVYNGEIYNFPSLVKELEARGHRFRTRCDTEVIVHAWEEWGPRCLERFRGMFAFALWDRNADSVFLARDRLGIKPLYYAVLGSGVLVFASELKAIMLHPDFRRELDSSAVEDFFAYGYVPDPRTIFAQARKLPPGHYVLCRRGAEPLPTQYWDVSLDPSPAIDEDALCEELIARLRDAVDVRLVADVPLGAFLSGGVDSSAVVSQMARLSADPVHTCAIAFSERAYDESPYAARVAERYRTHHHVHQVAGVDVGLVDSLADIYDEPFADSSALPTFQVCALARRDVKVALSGDGGDEIFAGYRRYRWHAWEEQIRRNTSERFRRTVFGLLGAAYPKLDWAPRVFRAKTTLQALARDSVGGFFHSVSFVPDGHRARLLTDSLQRDLQGYRAQDLLRRHMAAAPTDDPLARVQYADLKTYLAGDILTKVDRASMANSLEVRVPILDHQLLEWAMRIPSGLKLRGREGKHILKKALEPWVDREVLYREKMGFAVPLAAWLRGPLRGKITEAVEGPLLYESGYIDRAYARRLLEQHQSRRFDHSTPLWCLLVFEQFLRKTYAQAVPQAPVHAMAGR